MEQIRLSHVMEDEILASSDCRIGGCGGMEKTEPAETESINDGGSVAGQRRLRFGVPTSSP